MQKQNVNMHPYPIYSARLKLTADSVVDDDEKLAAASCRVSSPWLS